MTRFSKRRSVLTLALCGTVLSSLACDNLKETFKGMESEQAKADRRVQAGLDSGVKARRAPTTQSLTAALADLTKAAGENGASHTSRIRARSLLGQTEFQTGQRTVREVNAIAPTISRLLWEINQTASQVKAFNDVAKALGGTNPETTLKAIGDKRAEMSTAADAAGKKAGELQAEIDKTKGQVASLIQQKDAAIATADTDADKASKLSGKEAAALMDQVGENRRKAGNTGHDIDKLTAALLPLERDLAAEQAKKATADAAIAALDENKKVVETNWAATQTQMQEQKALVAKLGEELAAKAKELDDLKKQASALRTKAVSEFAKAATHYAAAANDAKTLSAELQLWSNKEKFKEAPEKKAWERLRGAYNLNVFKLLEAEADNAVGSALTVEAEQLRAQQQVVTAINEPLQTGGVTVPAPLGTAATVDEEAKKAAADAGAAYVKAAEKFLAVYESGTASGTPKDVQQAARISRMFSLYGQYLDSDRADKAKLDDARKEFQEAFGDRKEDPIVKAMPEDLRA